MKYNILGFVLFVAVLPTFAQDPHETGILMLESTFDDFDPGPMNTGGLTVIGVFDDIPDNNTPVLELDLPGGTANSWNELLQINWDTPENSESVIWRFQFRIRVTNTPYDAQVRLQINQEPWNGFNISRTIPEGAEEKWLFFDFLGGPFNQFNFDVLNFSLRFGAQQPQLMWLDDIRVYQSRALALGSFESRVDDRLYKGFNVETARIDEDNAPEGFQVLQATVTSPGSSLSDAQLVLSRYSNAVFQYEGAVRFTLDVRSSIAPLNVRGGLSDSQDLDGNIVYAQDVATIETAGAWTTVSFLVAPLITENRFVFPFIQLGGQGNVELNIDHLSVLRTEEAVDAPVAVHDWSLWQ